VTPTFGDRATRLLLAVESRRGQVCPTVRELRVLCGYQSTASVHRALERLKAAGLVEWEPGKPRTLRACVRAVGVE
jgi:SOS-response transcriptional repressor LexA